MKKYEIEDLIEKQEKRGIVITCLVETHQTEDRYNWNTKWDVIERRREDKDKKGGGLMLIQKRDDTTKLKKKDTRNADILVAEGKIENAKTKIILVYLATGSSNESRERNNRIKEELEETLNESEDDEGIIILGDFNGHISEIGKQKEDRNGKIMKQIADLYNLSILNLEEKCIGSKTWGQKDVTSTIDFVLVNNKMRNQFNEMRIDEKQEKCELSDHNLIEVLFRWERKINWNKVTRKESSWYWRTDERSMKRYTQELQRRLNNNRIVNITELNNEIREAADMELKKKYTRKGSQEEKVEPPWMNNNIRKEIKERKRINRTRRNTKDEEEREALWKKYQEKKLEVQHLIKEAIKEHERKRSEEVRSNRNKVWENIKRLKGEPTKKETNVQIHNDNGEVLNEEERRNAVKEFWTNIYQKHENRIKEEWSEEEQYKYNERMKMQTMAGSLNLYKKYPKAIEDHIGMIKTKVEIYFPKVIREHMDMEVEVKEATERREITKDEVIKVLKGLRKGKAPGPDGLKAELYSAMLENETCIETLTECLESELQRGEKPEQWKLSKTILIKKKMKPTVKDFRPLALTDISYKIFMSILRNRIEEHIENNKEIKEEQAGFTKGARIEDNIAIIHHLIKDARVRKKQLIITGIDFTKAFDSVRREKLVETLKYYKIDERIITAIAEIYTDDIVELQMGEDFKERVVASSGIRQGCTLSATLFKLLTYRIITEMNTETRGYKTASMEIRTLFFADDGLVINESLEEASHSIKSLQKIANVYGLEINKEKSSILTFNTKNEPSEIEGIKTAKEMKYLGIWIEDKRDIFRKHKETKLKLAQKLSNTTYSVTNRSCNRMLIGKTFWKNVALPAILYGSAVIEWNRKEEQQLQTIQNAVSRKILNAPKYATICSMRGEIGMSMMKTRLIQLRIGYVANRLSKDVP